MAYKAAGITPRDGAPCLAAAQRPAGSLLRSRCLSTRPALPLAPGKLLGCPLHPGKGVQHRNRPVRVTRAALGAKQYTVDVEKPLGIKFKDLKSEQGGLIVTEASGNAAKAGITKGDTVIYTSSFFGDELWPSDSANFTRTALAKAPSPVCIVYVKGENDSITVRRLPKKAAPPRFGRSLTPQQRENATHICLDCGFIYYLRKPFEEQSEDYRCPQCQAPKKRFAAYDVETGKPKGGFFLQAGTLATVVGGLVGIGLLFFLGLKV